MLFETVRTEQKPLGDLFPTLKIKEELDDFFVSNDEVIRSKEMLDEPIHWCNQYNKAINILGYNMFCFVIGGHVYLTKLDSEDKNFLDKFTTRGITV